MQIYFWTKTAHLVFVIAWMATVFYLPRILVNLAEAGDEPAVRCVSSTMGCSRSTIGTSTEAWAGWRFMNFFSSTTSGVQSGGWAKRARRACGVCACTGTAGRCASTPTTGTARGSKSGSVESDAGVTDGAGMGDGFTTSQEHTAQGPQKTKSRYRQML